MTATRFRRKARRFVSDVARLAVIALVIGGATYAATHTVTGRNITAKVAATVESATTAATKSGTTSDPNPGGWVKAGSVAAAALPTAGNWATFTPGAGDIDRAVAVLTQPDEGQGGATTRWMADTVEVRISLPANYDPAVRTTVETALAWMSVTTGTSFVVTDSPNAPFVVEGYGRDQGYAKLTYGANRSIVRARIQIGCCRERIAWEETLHGAGPVGDHGADGTLFSNTTGTARPTGFDAWLVHNLYRIPAGSSSQQLRDVLSN